MTKERNQDDTVAPRRRGRRQFMVGGAAAGAGLAAGMLADAEPAAAANGKALKLGQANTASATTTLTAGSPTAGEATALRVRATTDSGIGIEGLDGSAKGDGYGIFGNSPNGTAIYGVSGSGTGVSGRSGSSAGVSGNSNSGDGVSGTTDSGYGVHGLLSPDSTFGAGVFGEANGRGGVGVLADADAEGGRGVFAESHNGIAVYAYGNAVVTGTLSKAGGSFTIDHPLDPAHKYLYHSFVESPDMKNVYDGTVTLDSGGRATVGLPDWFETLNRDFRYQLTAIGAAAPDLHIGAKLTGGCFAIAGGKPGLEVSWQVTGIRQDAWANAHRIPVEVDKPAADQGRYLHPDLYEDGHGEPVEALMVGRRHAHRVRTVSPHQPA